MTFKDFKKDTDCDCLSDAKIDINSIFARIICNNPLEKSDFESHWDRGKRSAKCKDICGYKGVSMSIIVNEEIKKEIITFYSTSSTFAPNYKNKILFFKFKENAGYVKATPNKKNKFHHDFYKSDLFEVRLIENIESHNFNNLVSA